MGYAFNEISVFECVICHRVVTQAPHMVSGLLHCTRCYSAAVMPEWRRRAYANDAAMPPVAKDLTEYVAS